MQLSVSFHELCTYLSSANAAEAKGNHKVSGFVCLYGIALWNHSEPKGHGGNMCLSCAPDANKTCFFTGIKIWVLLFRGGKLSCWDFNSESKEENTIAHTDSRILFWSLKLHSFNKHEFRASNTPGTILSDRETTVNKTQKSLPSCNLYS